MQLSHTLHATLDGALFIVIDLLLPSLTCSLWLSGAKDIDINIKVTQFLMDAELTGREEKRGRKKSTYGCCVLKMYAFSHLSVFHIFTYIWLWLERGQLQHQGLTVSFLFAVTGRWRSSRFSFMTVWPHSLRKGRTSSALMPVSQIDLF